ncbi:hypothetical protein [Ferviditalea candida]|uniref:Uncharacterized protein n=1 Tax=Ferviditalea candida TaxID=3108399 RepID=A0ABU5ZMS7_9BACL|nr:hypothetical protein [Paenibacillaceae bacterium T2]
MVNAAVVGFYRRLEGSDIRKEQIKEAIAIVQKSDCTKGSAIASVIFGFMILGFLALENALLYKGFLFCFQLNDTLYKSPLHSSAEGL